MRLIAISPILLLTLAYAPNTVVRAECDTIATCKVKGQSIWNSIASATTDKPGISAQYAKYYKALEHSSSIGTQFNVGRSIKDLMAGVGLKLPANVNKVEIKGKSGTGAAAYENIYSDELIAAINNFKAEDPVDPAHQVNWNVIAFEQYKEKQKAASLTYVLRYNIDNKATSAVITEVYKAAGKGGEVTKDDTNWVTWTHSDHPDYILALLGTTNGSGAGFILTDYAGTLGRKTIASIHTRRYEKAWAMVVQYQGRPVTESFLTSHPIVRFVGGLLGA
jgi:hypothetical protein